MVVEKIGDEENFTQKEALTPADDGQQTRSRVWRVRKQTRVNSRGSVGYAILSRLFPFIYVLYLYLLSYQSFIFGLHNHALLGIRIVFDTSQLFYNKLRREHPRLFIYLLILIIS